MIIFIRAVKNRSELAGLHYMNSVTNMELQL